MRPDLKLMTFINSGKAPAVASVNNDSGPFSVLPLELQIDVRFPPLAHLLVVSPPSHVVPPAPPPALHGAHHFRRISRFRDSLLNCEFHASVIPVPTSRERPYVLLSRLPPVSSLFPHSCSPFFSR